jgi:hypothetical protein
LWRQNLGASKDEGSGKMLPLSFTGDKVGKGQTKGRTSIMITEQMLSR